MWIPRWLIVWLACAASPAWAGTSWNMRCIEFQVQGMDRSAECGGGLFMRGPMRGEPTEMTLRVGYATKAPREEYVSFTLQVHRIEMPGEAEAVLTVVGLRIEQTAPSGEQRASAQGPASGRCEVSGLDRPEPEFRCAVQAANASVGNLRFAMSVDAAATRNQFGDQFYVHPAKYLREARFTLAAAEQAGALAKVMAPASRALAAAAPAAPQGPLTEKNCATEPQARGAEVLAATGGAAAARLAALCWRAAAHGSPDKGESWWQRSLDWFDKAIASGDARSMVEKGLTIDTLVRQGDWDPATSSFKRRSSPAQLTRGANEQSGALYRQAAERGDAQGQFHYCQHLQLPDHGACAGLAARPLEQMRCQAEAKPRDPAGAVRQCQAASDQGYGPATVRLADFYASGFGVPKDPARSRQLVWRAAEQGDTGTLYNLARAYEAGMEDTPAGPIERDIGKAIELYRRLDNTAKVAELTTAQGRLGANVDATVFGIGVGFALPSLPACDGFAANPDARLCVDGDTGAFARFLDRIGLGQQAFAESGLRLVAVKVNDRKMDTRLLFGLLGQSAAMDVAIDRNRTVHHVSAWTRITEGDAVLQMLSAKYGRPTRSEWAEWRNVRTGELTRRTPIHRWALRGLYVDFHAQSASTLGNLETPMGRIDIYTPTFSDLLARFAAQKAAEQPKGRF